MTDSFENKLEGDSFFGGKSETVFSQNSNILQLK